jgi:hypothetical protein
MCPPTRYFLKSQPLAVSESVRTELDVFFCGESVPSVPKMLSDYLMRLPHQHEPRNT